jgi:cholesterol transport system auxiliary component
MVEVGSQIKHQTSSIKHLLILCIFALLGTSGCSYWAQANKMDYLIDPGRPQQTASGQPHRVLEVDRFTIEEAFAAKSLVYRTGEFQYQSDFYNQFLVVPSVMITEQTRDWLSRSGLFERVGGPAMRAGPTHLIEGNVVELCGDLRDKNSPAAVMQIRIFVSKFESENRPTLIYGRDYSAKSRLESHDPAGLVDAYSRCLHAILTDLQKDLAERL